MWAGLACFVVVGGAACIGWMLRQPGTPDGPHVTAWTPFDAVGAELTVDQRAEFAAIVAPLDDVRRTGKRLVRKEGR